MARKFCSPPGGQLNRRKVREIIQTFGSANKDAKNGEKTNSPDVPLWAALGHRPESNSRKVSPTSTTIPLGPGAIIAQQSLVMDDTKKMLLSVFLTFSLVAVPVAATEIEYISPDKQHQLEDLFAQSDFAPARDNDSLKTSKWQCDMYGVRTHMQVQHKLELYKWTSVDKTTDWHNEGAQVVSEYKVLPGALVGTHERLEDQVKLTRKGQLISRLSVISPQRTVVAYSVCNSL